jgi:hypothetical protein
MYLVPEFVLLIESLVLGPRFTYYGNTVFGNDAATLWFTVVQAVITAVIATSTLALLRDSRPPIRHQSIS